MLVKIAEYYQVEIGELLNGKRNQIAENENREEVVRKAINYGVHEKDLLMEVC